MKWVNRILSIALFIALIVIIILIPFALFDKDNLNAARKAASWYQIFHARW